MAACPPPSVFRPALTRSTEPRTTSDTLCRSSAAVPGLLSARVNFRVSAEAGTSDSCDILAAAAAAPAPAVWSNRAAARCALGASPEDPSAAARLLPPPRAALPRGAALAALSPRCHARRRPPQRPRTPAFGAAPGLAKGDRACAGGGGGSPMPPASLRDRSPGRLLGAGCPAQRGAGRAEEGPARRDSGPRRSAPQARSGSGARRC